jgi:hypothetical protein
MILYNNHSDFIKALSEADITNIHQYWWTECVLCLIDFFVATNSRYFYGYQLGHTSRRHISITNKTNRHEITDLLWKANYPTY